MTVLVCGATGAQGGAVVRALVGRGCEIRAMLRDPGGEAGLRLASQGVRLARGDLDDPASLHAALEGARAVFSVQLADYPGRDAERSQAGRLIAAAQTAGVAQVVHASVSGAGWRADHPGRGEGDAYWDSKEAVEEAMRAAGFDALTILRPAFMMENLIAPKAARMFPDLPRGEIVTTVAPDTRVAWVAADDIGQAAAAAFLDPDRFAGAEIELAGDHLTLPEAGAVVSDAAGRPLLVRTLPPDQVVARGQSPGWAASQLWLNDVGYPARPSEMIAWGLLPTSLRAWAETHREELRSAVRHGDDR